MAIWDNQGGGGDPMKMLLLASMAQGLGRSLSKSTNTNYYGQQPQGGGGMEEMLPEMMRMQQLQAQMANQNADNELQRRQFEAGQAAAAQKQETVRQAAAAMGVPEAVALANPDAVVSAWADRLKAQNVAPGHSVVANGQELFSKPALLQMGEGGFGDVERGIFRADPQMTANALGLRKASRADQRTVVHLPPAENEREKVIGKASGEEYVKVGSAARAAEDDLRDYEAMQAILAGETTGMGADQLRLAADKIGAFVGFPVNPQSIADREVANTISNKMTLKMMNAAETDIGSQISNKDLDFVRAIPPGIEMTPLGRDFAVDKRRAEVEWLKKRDREMRAYEQSLGGRTMTRYEQAAFMSNFSDNNSAYEKLADKWGKKIQEGASDPLADIDPNDPEAIVGGLRKAGKL